MMSKIKISIEDENGIKNFEYDKSRLHEEYSFNPMLYNTVNSLATHIASKHMDNEFTFRLMYLVSLKIKENHLRRREVFGEFLEKEITNKFDSHEWSEEDA